MARHTPHLLGGRGSLCSGVIPGGHTEPSQLECAVRSSNTVAAGLPNGAADSPDLEPYPGGAKGTKPAGRGTGALEQSATETTTARPFVSKKADPSWHACTQDVAWLCCPQAHFQQFMSLRTDGDKAVSGCPGLRGELCSHARVPLHLHQSVQQSHDPSDARSTGGGRLQDAWQPVGIPGLNILLCQGLRHQDSRKAMCLHDCTAWARMVNLDRGHLPTNFVGPMSGILLQ